MSNRPSLACFVLLAIASIVAGCGGGEAGVAGEAARARDSAGVRIVESPVRLWSLETAWRVSAEPSLVIGSFEGDPGQQLFRVGDAVELSDGRIVVANAENELRFFDAEGGHLRTVGGDGEGPGEFKDLSGLEVRRDTIVAFDRVLGRLTRFEASGELLDVISLAQPGTLPHGRHMHRLGGLLGEDELVLETWAFDASMRQRAEVYWDSLPNLRYGLDGTFRDSIGRFGGMEMFATEHRSTFRPFGRLTTSDVSGDRFLIGDGARLEFEVYSVDGLERIVRAAFEPEPVTDALVEELVMGPLRERVAELPPEARPDGLLEFYESIPYPEMRPAYSEIVVDSKGNVWLREHQWRGETGPTDWYVFGADDVWLGTVTVPRRLSGTRIYADHLIGSWTDELGVEYVLRYEITKP